MTSERPWRVWLMTANARPVRSFDVVAVSRDAARQMVTVPSSATTRIGVLHEQECASSPRPRGNARTCPNCAGRFTAPGHHDGQDFCPHCLFILPERAQQPRTSNRPRPKMNTAPTKTGRKRRGRLAKLLARDGDRCWLCGYPLGEDMTYDHVIPRSRGGTNKLANLRLAHYRCNTRRGAPAA